MATFTPTRDITGIVLSVLLLGILLAASFWVMQPFLPALVWAATIVVSSWSLMLRVERRLGGSRVIAVFIMTGGLILVLMLPLSIAISAISDNIGYASSLAQEFLNTGFKRPPYWLEKIPLVGERIYRRWSEAASLGRDEVLSKLAPFVGDAISWLVQEIGSWGKIIFHFLLTVLLSAILYLRGEIAAAGILRFAKRLAQKRGEEAVILAAQAIRAVASGVIITAVIQTAMAGIGFFAAGIPYAVILSSITFLLSVIQIGAGPVLIGTVIWLFYTEATVAAWIFLIWSILIMATDNLVRPYLIKRGADLPLLLIFGGVIGGLISFGIIGIFVGPVVLAVSYTLLQAWVIEAPQPA